ncbi:MAG: hydroxyethylthiazole kinase [Candidatus Merdivicinus sp.]|jgi:hydroxyethylthiazole kinase
MLGECLTRMRQCEPLIHCITNHVTINDVANVLLAGGARPIMADDPGETAEITAHCGGLTINIGTLDSRKVPGMLASGKIANQMGIPAVFDPVGAGASRLRTETALSLLHEIHFGAIRGNMSEIKTLAAENGHARGVDAGVEDAVTEENLGQVIPFLRNLAAQWQTILAVTGRMDLVSDAERCFIIRNGHPEMRKVTGTGCQLSALTAAFLAANPETPLEAVAAAVCTMGIAGEIGWKRMRPEDGNLTYRGYIIDAIYNMTAERLEKEANFEIQSETIASLRSH